MKGRGLVCCYFFYSPNSVSTLRGSYGRCKGRCLIRVLTLGPSIFPVNFLKWQCISTAQARTKGVCPRFGLNPGRRLAHSVVPGLGRRHYL